MAGPGSMVGGFSGSKQVDEEVSALVGSVKGDVEKVGVPPQAMTPARL